jgi:hypothetical protein
VALASYILQDEAPGAELAVTALLELADDEEQVEQVLDVGPGEAVDVGRGRIELGAQQLPGLRDPAEWRLRLTVVGQAGTSRAYGTIRWLM